MASAMLSHLQNIWPFSILRTDDLKLSNQLVRKLSIPESTKKFIFATKEPDSHAVVYILAAQNLSKQSALDAEKLIKEVKPQAVVCLVASSALAEIQEEEKTLLVDQANNVPTSSLGVLRKCLVNKVNKEQYEKYARCQVVQEIFGIGLYGHLFAAKKAAEDIGSKFILLESPYERSSASQIQGNVKIINIESSSKLKISKGEAGPDTQPNSERIYPAGTLQTRMVDLILPSVRSFLENEITSNNSSKGKQDERKPEGRKDERQSKCDYEAPTFARSIYPVLIDLHDIFSIIPAIKKALTSAREMLSSVNKGEPVNAQILAEVHNFRIAIEALRIALNEAARHPLKSCRKSSMLELSQISSEDTGNAICAQALRGLARKSGTLVAIVDAGKLAGLRRHWTTPVPPEVAELTEQCFTHYSSDYINADRGMTSNLLVDKPEIMVGAGATAVIRATSLLKTVPVYALIKLATFKFPTSLKYGLENLQRTAEIGLCTRMSGVSGMGTKASTLNLSVSAELIRSAAHSLIGLAEKTGLLAVQTSFFEIMRRRRVGSAKVAPWATFCCSMATCSGLVVYKDGIQCAADSVPSVPMIASMGRGLERLQQASEEVKQRSGTKVQEGLHSLNNLKKIILDSKY